MNQAAAEAVSSTTSSDMQLVTHQTGPEGKKVQRLLVEQGLDIEHEYYLGITLDRATGRVTVMASTEGGMEVEEVAEKSPEKILKETINPAGRLAGLSSPAPLASRSGLSGEQVRELGQVPAVRWRNAYDETDCSLVEINPLVTTKTAGSWRSTPRSTSTTTPSTATRTSPSCATSTRRIRSRSRPRSSTSTTSSSTATSAAWSTAPVWRWRPWTSSSTTAASRPTSSTWVAAPPQERVAAAFKHHPVRRQR